MPRLQTTWLKPQAPNLKFFGPIYSDVISLNESQLKPLDAREYLQLRKNEELGKLCKRLATFNGVDAIRKQMEKTPKTLMESIGVE